MLTPKRYRAARGDGPPRFWRYVIRKRCPVSRWYGDTWGEWRQVFCTQFYKLWQDELIERRYREPDCEFLPLVYEHIDEPPPAVINPRT